MAQTFKTAISIVSNAASGQAVAARVDGDTTNRINVDAGGKITWGDGSAAGDTTLYRSAADLLKTDDAFEAASLTVIGDATIDTSTLKVDSTNNRVGVGTVNPTESLDVVGNVVISGSLYAATKSFDIEHPTKDGMRLRYGSVEAPEHSVQVRGRCDSDVIKLPDYWKDLVDESTITVQLTAMGRKQSLFVKWFDVCEVHVGGSRRKDFFFTVSAERKDVERLVVEYGDGV